MVFNFGKLVLLGSSLLEMASMMVVLSSSSADEAAVAVMMKNERRKMFFILLTFQFFPWDISIVGWLTDTSESPDDEKRLKKNLITLVSPATVVSNIFWAAPQWETMAILGSLQNSDFIQILVIFQMFALKEAQKYNFLSFKTREKLFWRQFFCRFCPLCAILKKTQCAALEPDSGRLFFKLHIHNIVKLEARGRNK